MPAISGTGDEIQERAMKLRNFLMVAALATAAYGVNAQVTVKRIYATPNARIASAIWAGDTLYVSGMGSKPVTPADPAKGTPAVWGDTEQQTMGALTAIESTLKDQGLTMADVVEMQVFLVGDPAKGGKLDFAGMNASYAKFFGTTDQPNRPVRAAIQLAALANPNALVEIMVVAVKSAPAAPVKSK
jgi:enamine deaminase RidA (YjgF/YER057c/UK114 family)